MNQSVVERGGDGRCRASCIRFSLVRFGLVKSGSALDFMHSVQTTASMQRDNSWYIIDLTFISLLYLIPFFFFFLVLFTSSFMLSLRVLFLCFFRMHLFIHYYQFYGYCFYTVVVVVVVVAMMIPMLVERARSIYVFSLFSQLG